MRTEGLVPKAAVLRGTDGPGPTIVPRTWTIACTYGIGFKESGGDGGVGVERPEVVSTNSHMQASWICFVLYTQSPCPCLCMLNVDALMIAVTA